MHCTIRFTQASGGPVSGLPKAVRRLLDDLDVALGHSGQVRGTLHAVARTRQHARRVLFNVALRPWALAEDGAVYNSRREVDAGLEKWAKITPSYARILADIQKTYPQAKNALATYYTDRFHIARAKARKQARWTLDLMYRSWFVFHSDASYFRYDGVNTNPWSSWRSNEAAGVRTLPRTNNMGRALPAPSNKNNSPRWFVIPGSGSGSASASASA